MFTPVFALGIAVAGGRSIGPELGCEVYIVSCHRDVCILDLTKPKSRFYLRCMYRRHSVTTEVGPCKGLLLRGMQLGR